MRATCKMASADSFLKLQSLLRASIKGHRLGGKTRGIAVSAGFMTNLRDAAKDVSGSRNRHCPPGAQILLFSFCLIFLK